ncbi:MAG: enoyl-CoA hydratase/carnithine racemase/3-hydroxyacyl-CoA dehydrogenase [Granulosicoccus sp.]|jgi:enoyl-CoA hydratase/carnithine racemase/3-hydroxyacyl-CoA dehydrogenase
MTVTFRRDGFVGYVQVNNPPMNATEPPVRKGLLHAVKWAESEGLDRVILSGAGQFFATSADVKNPDAALVEPDLPNLLTHIENSYVPWIAAIDGDALGAGAELALACRMRIITPSSSIGFSELTPALTPGTRGTQRLPRLIGFQSALDMLINGEPVNASSAKKLGLVDDVDEDPIDESFMVNTEELLCRVPAVELPAPVIDASIMEATLERISKSYCATIQPDIESLARSIGIATVLNEVPVVVGVNDGLITNRILARYEETAYAVLLHGSTPWEIDEAMVEFGFATGPYETQDLEGLDVALANRHTKIVNNDLMRRSIAIAERLVELGKLGRKTGAGWYRYPGGNGKVDDPIVADIAIEEAHFAEIKRVEYSADEIRERLLLSMINEAANILHEGIAQSAQELDLVSILGYGFPHLTGGLMHYADSLGVDHIIKLLCKLQEEDKTVWKVSTLFEECANQDISIRQWSGE